MWEEVASIRGLWEEPWYLGGDLNVVPFPVEKGITGGSP